MRSSLLAKRQPAPAVRRRGLSVFGYSSENTGLKYAAVCAEVTSREGHQPSALVEEGIVNGAGGLFRLFDADDDGDLDLAGRDHLERLST